VKTHAVKAGEIERRWYVVNAEGKILGRLATRVATILRGKHKPTFSTHLDCGDHVIIINAKKIRVTGNRLGRAMIKKLKVYPGDKHPHVGQQPQPLEL